MTKRNWPLTNLMLAIVIFSLGCRASKPLQMPAVTLPASYDNGNTRDSAGIGDLPWRKLFNDAYLVSLIDSTLANNPDLHRAAQRISIAQNQYRIRNGALRPRLDARLSVGADKFGKYTMTGVGNFDTNLSGNINPKQRTPMPVTPDYFLGLQSSWEIDVWGKLKNLKKAAYLRYLATAEGVRLMQTSLVSEISSRYFELLALDNELKIINSNIRLQAAALEIVEVQKQAGRANELAVQQFRAQLLNTRALSGITLQQITETENELNILRGRYPQPISRDTTFRFRFLPGTVQTGLPAQLLFRRPDIRQAEHELFASKADLAAARASFYPSLAINPYLGFSSFKLPLLFNPASLVYGILVNITAPLFSQGVLKRNYKIADATRIDSYYAYKKVVLQSMAEVMSSISGIRNMTEVYKIKEEEVDVLKEAVTTSNLLFKTGKASYLEVIAAQQNVINAELQLVDTKRRISLFSTGLYRSLGGGWK